MDIKPALSFFFLVGNLETCYLTGKETSYFLFSGGKIVDQEPASSLP